MIFGDQICFYPRKRSDDSMQKSPRSSGHMKKSENPPLCTLNLLPTVLGIDRHEIVNGLMWRDEVRTSQVPMMVGDGWNVPNSVIYKVQDCQRVLKKGIPGKKKPSLEDWEPHRIDRIEREKRVRLLLTAMFERHGLSIRESKGPRGTLRLAVEHGGWHVLWDDGPSILVVVCVLLDVSHLLKSYLSSPGLDLPILEKLLAALHEQATSAIEGCDRKFAAVVSDWRHALDESFLSADEMVRPATISMLGKSLGKGLVFFSTSSTALDSQFRSCLDAVLDDDREEIEIIAHRLRIRALTGYDRYPALFPLARSLNRKLILLIGPTNSGKTHEALAIASGSASSQILSPLRLLALEHRDAMLERGLNAGLITGEERINPDAPHVARTIETLELNRLVDVVIIDEIQKIDDRQRGWAWTQALIGAPAHTVVMTGSESALPVVTRIAEELGESLEIRQFERKSSLETLRDPASIASLQKGDAIVAFSRRDVHEWRERVHASGRSVATIYGALGPEVRRAEANRFRSGEADVLIATDAIGMGLNLPIRRIFFTTTEKFDGQSVQPMPASAILQIAGRAGRHGHHENGFVGVMRSPTCQKDLHRISDALQSGARPLSGKAFVRPNLDAIQMTAEVLGTDRLRILLEHLRANLVREHPALRMSDLDDDISKAERLDRITLPLTTRYGYVIAPINLNGPGQVERLVSWAHQHATDGFVRPYAGVPSVSSLDKLEGSVQSCTAWLWLAQRFPEQYRQVAAVQADRQRLNEEIEKRLLKTSLAKYARRLARKTTVFVNQNGSS